MNCLCREIVLRHNFALFILAYPTFLSCSDSGVTIHNSSPEVLITSHDGGIAELSGAKVALRGSVNDPDDDFEELLTIWYANDEVICEDVVPDAYGSVSCEFQMVGASTTINLTAVDPSGATGSDSVSIPLEGSSNEAPTVTITDPADGAEYADGETVIFQALLSDNNDDPEDLTVSWSSDINGVFSTQGADAGGSTVAAVDDLSIGDHIISVTATDSDGYLSSDYIAIEIGDCLKTWWEDVDEDGFGDPDSTSIEACDEQDGYSSNDDDCDDLNPWVNPAATEECDDGLDNDCDGLFEEGCPGSNCFEDSDYLGMLASPVYQTVSGTIDGTDAASALNFYRDDVEFEAESGQELVIHLYSEVFDAYVELYDEDCNLYASSNGGARGSNAAVEVTIPTTGVYTVLVTTGSAEEYGDYVLELVGNGVDVGSNCLADLNALDVVTNPYSDSMPENLSPHDQNIMGYEWDDFEYYSFYGDEVTIGMTSHDFDPTLGLYSPTGSFITLNKNADGISGDAEIVYNTERTGIFCVVAWAEYLGQYGDYTVSVEASW